MKSVVPRSATPSLSPRSPASIEPDPEPASGSGNGSRSSAGSGPRSGLRSAPRSGEVARHLAIPEIKALRDLRFALARGGLPTHDKRTPEDNARIAAFRTLEELLRMLDHYRRKIEAGERCRLVEREHARDAERMILEIEIVVDPRF